MPGVPAAGAAALGEDSSEEETSALEDELSLRDDAAPARALNALNALRKSRQHYDTVLLAGGAELPAHRAVLAAASPYLLHALPPAPGPAPPAYRVPDVDAEALRALVEYAYSGRLRVREAGAARRLYRAAWRLRVEPVRAHLAAALLRRVAPPDCLELRALPDLGADHLAALDAYIAQNVSPPHSPVWTRSVWVRALFYNTWTFFQFDEVCKSGALATLPLIRIEMLRETSAEGGDETAFAVADAALVWLRDQQAADVDVSVDRKNSYTAVVRHSCPHTFRALQLDDLCSRTHLLYVDGRGALRDCGDLPAARGDAPELQEYRREAAERGRAARRVPEAPALPEPPALQLGARTPRSACCVLAATRAPPARTTRALLALRGRLVAARVAWRDVGGAGGAGVARGGVLGGALEPGAGGRAHLLHGRAAHGSAVLGGRLLVCGGYDRARVLRAAEAYDPLTNEWSALPELAAPRARFPAAVLGGALFALGGSDGHAELSSVVALSGGRWSARARLPLALSHAGAAAVEERGELYVIGGWSGGVNLKRVLRYSPDADEWTEAPPLNAGEPTPIHVHSLSVAPDVSSTCRVGRRSVAVRRRVLGGRAVGAGRLRRVALPGQHGGAVPARRRGAGVARRAGAAHGAAQCGRGGVARAAGGGGRLGRRGLAAAHGVAGGRGACAVAGGRGAGAVARRPRAAPPPRLAGPGRAGRRAVRRGRVRRQGVPGVRGVPVRAGRRVDHAAGAGRPAGAAGWRHARERRAAAVTPSGPRLSRRPVSGVLPH